MQGQSYKKKLIVAKIYFVQYLILLHVGSTYSMWFHNKLSTNNEIFFLIKDAFCELYK